MLLNQCIKFTLQMIQILLWNSFCGLISMIMFKSCRFNFCYSFACVYFLFLFLFLISEAINDTIVRGKHYCQLLKEMLSLMGNIYIEEKTNKQ